MSNFQKQIMESRHLIRDELEYLDVRGLNYSFEFERIDTRYWGQFMINTWWAPFVASAVYVALIFGLEKYMENRKPFDLRTPLIWWNAALGLAKDFLKIAIKLISLFYNSGFISKNIIVVSRIIFNSWVGTLRRNIATLLLFAGCHVRWSLHGREARRTCSILGVCLFKEFIF